MSQGNIDSLFHLTGGTIGSSNGATRSIEPIETFGQHFNLVPAAPREVPKSPSAAYPNSLPYEERSSTTSAAPLAVEPPENTQVKMENTEPHQYPPTSQSEPGDEDLDNLESMAPADEVFAEEDVIVTTLEALEPSEEVSATIVSKTDSRIVEASSLDVAIEVVCVDTTQILEASNLPTNLGQEEQAPLEQDSHNHNNGQSLIVTELEIVAHGNEHPAKSKDAPSRTTRAGGKECSTNAPLLQATVATVNSSHAESTEKSTDKPRRSVLSQLGNASRSGAKADAPESNNSPFATKQVSTPNYITVSQTVQQFAAEPNNDNVSTSSGPPTVKRDIVANILGRNQTSGSLLHSTESIDTDGPHVDPERFIGRVTKALQRAAERGGTLQLRLSPPELGSMRLELSVQDGVLTASVETETATARRVLLDNLPALRDRLAEQNIRVERFDVDVRRESGGNQTQDHAAQQHQNQHSHQPTPRRPAQPPQIAMNTTYIVPAVANYTSDTGINLLV